MAGSVEALLASLFFLLRVSSIITDDPCAAKQEGSGFVCVCNASYCDTFSYPTYKPGYFTHIFTSNANPGFNTKQLPLHNLTVDQENKVQPKLITITVNRSNTYQELKGVGGAFTDSFSIIVRNLSDNTAEHLLRSYFSPTGIQYNLGKVPIGSSDFSTRTYTYDDTPGDLSLTHFNLSLEDYQYKIPVLKAAQFLSENELSLIGATWTSPSWTKTNNDYLPGYQQKQYYQYWADYLIRFFDAYKKEGIDFWAVTAGNEPINPFILEKIFNVNSVVWTPASHRIFIKEHLGPTLRASEYNNIKVLTLDDTRLPLPWWMERVMHDPEVAQYIDGISLHWYRDTETSPYMLDNVLQMYGKFIIYTEACINQRLDPGPKVDLGSWRRAELYIRDIIETFNHFSVGFLDWNMALNLDGGPSFPASSGTDSAIIVDTSNDEFYKNPIFYALGHFSKFITQGSYRVESSSEQETIQHLATKNPDGTTSLFINNPTNETISVEVHNVNDKTKMKIKIRPLSISTLLWY